MVWLRSILYWLLLVIVTPLFTLIAILILPLPPVTRNRIIRLWSVILLKWLHITCGLKFKVEGAENIPAIPSMIMCKHQSAWETMALQLIFPPQVWVMKRELLKLPFFGWALATTSPIAIDRGQRAQAQRQLMEQGKDRLAKGLWIVIFPEGTRIKPGERGQYKQGGARLAIDLNVPIVPVALDYGRKLLVLGPCIDAIQPFEQVAQQIADFYAPVRGKNHEKAALIYEQIIGIPLS